MANEQQYYQPIVQAMLGAQQQMRLQDQMKQESQLRKAQLGIQQAQLAQHEKALEYQHEHEREVDEGLRQVRQANNVKMLRDLVLSGGNAGQAANSPVAGAEGVGPLGQGAMLPNQSYDPNKPTMDTGSIPISSIPSQAQQLNALQLESAAKQPKMAVPDWMQKSPEEGGYGLPSQAPYQAVNVMTRLHDARANLESNLAAKERMLQESNQAKQAMVDAQVQGRKDTAAIIHALSGSSKEDARGDRSYQFHVGQIQKEAIPIDSAVGRFGRITESLNQNNPVADSLIAPELLSMMAGGQGSGLRMTQPEINAIVGGRNKYEALQAWAQKYSTDPSKGSVLTPDQRTQIRALATAVGQKLQQKQQILQDARSGLVNSNDPQAHRQIFSDMQQKLNNVDNPPAPKPVTFKSPSGATRSFTDPVQIEKLRKTPGFTEVQ